jgi:probable rRNA maturation factor
MGQIRFFNEDISFVFPKKRTTSQWIKEIAALENKRVGDLNFIFCSDSHLFTLNQEYLQHDTYTDIITFDYSEEETIEGDIYISIDRIKENAGNLGIAMNEELFRVIIHGVLHLLGYKDKTKEEKELMREKEDYSLSLRKDA